MLLKYNPALKNMTFAEWLEYKKQQEKERTHGAERVTADDLLDAVSAINAFCFDRFFTLLPLYFMPDDLLKSHEGVSGLYGYGCIMINKAVYDAHKTDEITISTLYHEMLHAYCDIKDIKDTDGENHLKAFADAAENNNGYCVGCDEKYGYSQVQPNDEQMTMIKDFIKNMENYYKSKNKEIYYNA